MYHLGLRRQFSWKEFPGLCHSGRGCVDNVTTRLWKRTDVIVLLFENCYEKELILVFRFFWHNSEMESSFIVITWKYKLIDILKNENISIFCVTFCLTKKGHNF